MRSLCGNPDCQTRPGKKGRKRRGRKIIIEIKRKGRRRVRRREEGEREKRWESGERGSGIIYKETVCKKGSREYMLIIPVEN